MHSPLRTHPPSPPAANDSLSLLVAIFISVYRCRLPASTVEWRPRPPPPPIIMAAFVPAAAVAARTVSSSSTCRSRGSVASTFAAGSSPAFLSTPVSAPAPAAVAGVTMAAKREGVPLNLFRPKTPYNATVLYNGTLVGKDAPGETMHIVMNHDGNVPYLEGQSIGVMAPGVDAKGKPHKVRLYSIASTRHGDFGDGKTVSLSVKRLVYQDEEGKEVKGVCSNFLCDVQPGDKVAITGPVGTAMLMPEDPNATIIMLATGTGIAPFRTYMRRAFTENNPDFKFNGKMWLFLGYVERIEFVRFRVGLLCWQRRLQSATAVLRENTSAAWNLGTDCSNSCFGLTPLCFALRNCVAWPSIVCRLRRPFCTARSLRT